MHIPANVLKFFYWWFVFTPGWLFEFSRRILVLTNNEMSIFLNLRMLFVPLFNDYTLIGRLMGLVYRLIRIVFGLAFLLLLVILLFVINVFWLALPVIIILYFPVGIFIIGVLMYAIWTVTFANIPFQKLHRATEHNYLKSFRPDSIRFLDLLKVDKQNALNFLLSQKKVSDLLFRLELDNTDFEHKILSQEVVTDKIDRAAYLYAMEAKTRYVELEHVFLAYIVNINNYLSFLNQYSLAFEDVKSGANWLISRREFLAKVYPWQIDYETPVIGGVDRAMTGRVTPILDSMSTDFTLLAQKGIIKPVQGHKEEQQQVINLLGNSNRVNVLIVGPPGSGKTSLVKGIAIKIVNGTKEGSLMFKRLVAVEAGFLISGVKTAGELAAKIKSIMNEVEGSRGIILFFDEIHNLVVAGSEGESTIFSLLEPYIASGDLQIIGATNMENYRRYIEPNGSFSGLFQKVEIGPTDDYETLEILQENAFLFEKDYGVKISYIALKKTIELTKKLVHERVFPDKAIDILDRTVARVSKGNGFITGEEIAKTVSETTNIPVTAITQSEADKLLKIEEEMKKSVIGQDEAIVQISKALKRARVGIRSESKPIASFLFVGTTGVGKTETAKTLAKMYFGNEKSMIRLDMSEYQQFDSLNRLIGTPDGKMKGQLTSAVRSKPFSLILLDEIEKANSEVIMAFLQVLDDGRLTDSSGFTVDFTNSIIIATSNVGTREIQEVFSKNGPMQDITTVGLEKVREHFAPEFLNRFSGIIVYRPLSTESVRKIAILLLEKVRIAAQAKNLTITYSQELIEELVKRGYSPQWGARPLARVIEDTVETYIAEKILMKAFNPGDSIQLGVEVFESQ